MGDLFVGQGDVNGYLAYGYDIDPNTPGIQLAPGDTLPADIQMYWDLLGTYRVIRPEQPDASLDESVVAPVHAVTTGCAVDRLTGDLWATSFDGLTVDRLSGDHATGHGLVNSIDMLAAVKNPPGAVAVESIVFDRAGNAYVGLPDEDVDFNWAQGVEAYDTQGTLVKFSAAGVKLAQYRLPVNTYPTGYTPGPTDHQPRGIDWIDLSADGTTIFYTSEDRFIRTYVFDTNPAKAGDQPGPGPGNALTINGVPYPATPGVWGYVRSVDPADDKSFAFRLLPPGDGSGGAVAAAAYGLHRLNGAGADIMFMPEPAGSHGFFAVNLSPDAQYVWTATNGATPAVFKFHVASGRQMDIRGNDRLVMPAPINGLCVKLEYTSQSVDCTADPGNALCKPIEACSAASPGDDDGDGLPDAFDPDCSFGATEICGNGSDDDLDGLVDEICDRTNAENEAVTVTTGAGVPGETRVYSATGLPSGLAIDPATGVISGTVSFAAAETNGGNWPVTITLVRTTTGGLQSTATGSFVWHITDVNAPPEFEVHDIVVLEGANLNAAPIALPPLSDPDGDPLRWSVVGDWPYATFAYDSTAHAIVGVAPLVSSDQAYTLWEHVSDLDANGQPIHTIGKPFKLIVKNVNHPPVVTPPPPQVSVERVAIVPVTIPEATDEDGESMTYQVLGLPAGLAFDPATRVISGTPSDVPAGGTTSTVTIKVTDALGAVTTQTFTWTVQNVNRPPAIAVSPRTDNELTAVTFTILATDADGEALTYSVDAGSLPPGIGFTPATRTFAGTLADLAATTTYTVTGAVTDGLATVPFSFAWTVIHIPNHAPVCTGAALSGGDLWPPNHKLVPFRVTGVTDQDPDDTVTITITGIWQNEPTNSTGDGDTAIDGVIDGSTAWLRAERAGTRSSRIYRVTFTASDGIASCPGTVYATIVPHDQGKVPNPPTAPWYDSTIATPALAAAKKPR